MNFHTNVVRRSSKEVKRGFYVRNVDHYQIARVKFRVKQSVEAVPIGVKSVLTLFIPDFVGLLVEKNSFAFLSPRDSH